MPGWRVRDCCGNREVVGALAKIKSYLDYGIFQPLQIAIALNGPQDCVERYSPAISGSIVARCIGERAQSHWVEGG